MGKLFLVEITLAKQKQQPDDLRVFNELLYVVVREEGVDGVSIFTVDVISKDWLSGTNGSIYIKNGIVLDRYDEAIIKRHIDDLIEKCNSFEGKSSWNVLSHHLEFEYEEKLY